MFLLKLTPYYDDLVNAIIRPPRSKYSIEDLGSRLITKGLTTSGYGSTPRDISEKTSC